MNEEPEIREWVSIKHGVTSGTVATVSLQQGNHSVRWATKTTITHPEEGIREARSYAHKMLAKIKEAVA